MFDHETALGVIRDSFESLRRSGIISSKTPFSADMVVLGSRSELDSLGFVTFISDLEDRLGAMENRDVYLVLSDITDFNVDNPSLTVNTLASYLVGLTQAGQ